MAGTLWSALGMLFVTVLILLLAYWTSRWVGAHGAPGASGWTGGPDSEQFRVLARMVVGRSACLLIVRVRERCLLLGVTEGNIALLKEWEGAEADAWLTEFPADNGFMGVLRDALNARSRRK